MPDVIADPFIMGSAELTLGADSYKHSINSAAFVPTPVLVPWRSIGGMSKHIAGKASWVCNLGYPQDFEAANALARVLHEQEGNTIAAVFTPLDGGTTVTAELVIVPGQIGGDADALAASTVSLGCNGKPALSALGA